MKRLKSMVAAALAVVIAVTAMLPVSSASAVSSSALSISPKKNYVVEPGKSVDDTLMIRNLDATSPLELTIRVVDFTFTDDTGTPKLFLAEDAPQTTWSLKPFLTVPKTVTIEPSTSKSLDMSVAIPPGQGAGSYYSAIVYSAGSGSDGGNVGLSASGVTLVFTQIPGKVNEDLKLEKFGAYQKATPTQPAGYRFITTEKPDIIGYTLKNNGNVAESPVGSITIKGLLGGEKTITNVNPSGSLALIGQSRTFTACIKLKSEDINFNGNKSEAATCASSDLWPGMYTATMDIYYGQNGNQTQQVIGTASFWYLPWWFIIASIVALLIISYFVWRFVRFVRDKFGIKSHRPSRRRKK